MLEITEQALFDEHPDHPYQIGNFAPVDRVYPLTPCEYDGQIPAELAGGEYVRNGANPLHHDDPGLDAHWFDGDGMLTGVSFRRAPEARHRVQPEFVNQFILTDIYLSTVTTPSLRSPVLISIATLINPFSSLIRIGLRVLRTLLLVLFSHLPGSQQTIGKTSVANTAIYYHDGRALATCESGPPIRVALPGLETIGWFDGRRVEGEVEDENVADDGVRPAGFGGTGPFKHFREWTTGHPRIDPVTGEFIAYHSTVVPPYVRYSVVPSTGSGKVPATTPIFEAAIPGIKSAKMMHDFAVSSGHTVIMDVPLTLDAANLLRGRSIVSYNPNDPTRFGVFPRRDPGRVRWFETKSCCIFHSANTWDEHAMDKSGTSRLAAVNLLVCRLTSASLVYSAGNVATPASACDPSLAVDEVDQCRLYYYRFDMQSPNNAITHQWALSAISIEFPSVRDDRAMGPARYVYGCSSSSNFTAALGRTAKIDALVKVDCLALIERGMSNPPRSVTGCVDTRSMDEVWQSADPNDPIRPYRMPGSWYAQEPRFVPRRDGDGEDDGWLLFYVFDENQLDAQGCAPDSSRSELWILNAKNMRELVARVYLPQRVPYGLHGSWFDEQQVLRQRPVRGVRSIPSRSAKADADNGNAVGSTAMALWMPVRNTILRWLA